ncbi:CENPX protein, partial [Alaudala cheleensis]|nr:CENPX protein [Alaudala cheleensis]
LSPVPLSAQDTVDRLLRLHFRDGRTRVNADAQLLMAELLKVFIRGAPQVSSQPLSVLSFLSPRAAEAAARAARQAQAEDLQTVDTEHLEKVLPQLVCDC